MLIYIVSAVDHIINLSSKGLSIRTINVIVDDITGFIVACK